MVSGCWGWKAREESRVCRKALLRKALGLGTSVVLTGSHLVEGD